MALIQRLRVRVSLAFRAVLCIGACLLGAGGARADSVVLDDFESPESWAAGAPEGVEVAASRDPDGATGSALRIDYRFVTGGGYWVVRRVFDPPLELPENYRFAMDVRGDGLPNNLEFKLVGPSTDKGEDVWWVNRRAYEPPREWRTLADKRRSFEFAWGPSGGTPLKEVVAIEIALAMHEGGSGSLWLDNLVFEELPPPAEYTATPEVRVEAGVTTIDFRQIREFGGVVVRWSEPGGVVPYTLESSVDGGEWTPIATVRAGVGAAHFFLTPDHTASQLRIRAIGADAVPQLASFDVLPLEAGDDANAFLTSVAAARPRGWYPKAYTGKQCFWTVVGAPDSPHEGLLSEFGAYEVFKGGPTLEPFLRLDGRLVTWADSPVTCSLEDGYIPIPTVRWERDDVSLEVTAMHPQADPRRDVAVRAGVVRYRLTNTSSVPLDGSFALALRPMQVLPPWQRLNVVGGFTPIERIRIQDEGVYFNDAVAAAVALTPPDRVFATDFAGGDAVERFGAGSATTLTSVADASGLASAAMIWDFALEPGASRDIIVRVPVGKHVGPIHADPVAAADWAKYFGVTVEAESRKWARALNRARFSGPPEAMRVWDVVRSNLAYILINADGPAIQPGSRAYERSWIRDGSLTGTALLNLGHGEVVLDFLRWFSANLYESGKVPCVVDKRGPDPYPEHDSHGQYVFLVLKAALMTGDLGIVREYYPRALAAIDYMESLRNERMTPEYADPASDLHRFHGILPESGSHEGYMNKPMHSFWDDFFALKGLKDIVRMAEVVGDTENLPRLIALRDDFRRCFGQAIRRAIDDHDIDYIPGCVELGDFDATSTAIGIFPCGELDWMPKPETAQTFDRYWVRAEGRIADSIPWHDYTPYEVRIIGALALMGEVERAHALLEWLFLDILPKGWNHWAEVAYREDDFPGWIGDMPHTWVGSGFINSVRTMLIHERQRDAALVIGLGVPEAWLVGDGIAGTDFPTEYGPASFSMQRDGATIRASATVRDQPPGGLVVVVPGEGRILSATLADGTPTPVTGREVRIASSPFDLVVTLE